MMTVSRSVCAGALMCMLLTTGFLAGCAESPDASSGFVGGVEADSSTSPNQEAIVTGRVARNGQILPSAECNDIEACLVFMASASYQYGLALGLSEQYENDCPETDDGLMSPSCMELYYKVKFQMDRLADFEDLFFMPDNTVWRISTGLPIVPNEAPVIEGSLVRCGDGTTSWAGGKQGACSHHGGVSN